MQGSYRMIPMYVFVNIYAVISLQPVVRDDCHLNVYCVM